MMNKKYLVSWNDKDATRISRTITRTMSLLRVKNGKVRSLAPNSFRLFSNIAILASLIRFEGIESDELKRGLIYSTVFHLRKLKRRNLTGFKLALNRSAKKYLARADKSWHVIFPININKNSIQNKRWFTLLGHRFHKRNWASLSKRFDITEWRNSSKGHFPKDPDIWVGNIFVPFEVKVVARNYEEAFSKTEESYDLLRAAINWSLTANIYQRKWYSGRPDPLNPVLPAPTFCVFSDNGDFGGLYYTEFPPERYKSEDLNNDQITVINNLLGYFNKSIDQRKLSCLVTNAFRMYCNALDTADWAKVFLSLWQVLELITYNPAVTNQQYSIKEVRKRVRSLLNYQDDFIDDILDMVYRKRNILVHQGYYFEKGIEDIQFLKGIVENCLLSLMSRERSFPTWDFLETYYQNATADTKTLQKRNRIIKAILTKRP